MGGLQTKYLYFSYTGTGETDCKISISPKELQNRNLNFDCNNYIPNESSRNQKTTYHLPYT